MTEKNQQKNKLLLQPLPTLTGTIHLNIESLKKYIFVFTKFVCVYFNQDSLTEVVIILKMEIQILDQAVCITLYANLAYLPPHKMTIGQVKGWLGSLSSVRQPV